MEQLELDFDFDWPHPGDEVSWVEGRSALFGRFLAFRNGGFLVERAFFNEKTGMYGRWGDPFIVEKIFKTHKDAWASLPERTDL